MTVFPAVLEIAGLSLRIGGSPVLDDVSLTVGKGERVGLIGASGSGKSMTALAVMGLLPERSRTTGSVQLGGRELLGRDERRIASLRGAEMAMVFQEPMTALDPLMPVGRQVAEVVRLHRRVTAAAARSTALRLLKAVQLPRAATLFRVYPHQLSGGQRQRVVLAMAMVNDPGLLICDEPTTALDVTVQAAVLDLLRGLVTEHQTSLLFITHDLAVVSQMCERVVVMRGGRVVETGDVTQVFARPTHPYTASLLAVSDLTTVPPRSRLTTPAPGGGDSWP